MSAFMPDVKPSTSIRHDYNAFSRHCRESQTPFAYISEDNKSAAKKLKKRIYDGIKGLSDFPFKYPAIHEDENN